MFGDSTADQYAEGLISAANEVNSPVTISSFGGCPLSRLRFNPEEPPGLNPGETRTWSEICSSWSEEVFSFLETAKPGIVFLTSTDTVLRDAKWGFITPDQINQKATSKKIEIFAEDLNNTIEELEALGNHVVVIQYMPNFKEGRLQPWDPRKCYLIQLVFGKCSAEISTITMNDIKVIQHLQYQKL